MTIRDLGRAWPMGSIDVVVPARWNERDVELELGRHLLSTGAGVWHQPRWASGIPDIVAVSRVPVVGVRSLTVIEVKAATAGTHAMAQIVRYMAEAIEMVAGDAEEWVVQGAIAAPGIRVPEVLWPRWFVYMPLRILLAARAA